MKEITFTIKEKAGTQSFTITYISAAGMPRTRSFETIDDAIQNQGKLRRQGISSSLQINFSAVTIKGTKEIEPAAVTPPHMEEEGMRLKQFYKPDQSFELEVKRSPNYSKIEIKH